MVADWLNQMFSHGKPFLKFSRLHLVLRILQMCYDIRNGSYSCFCAANLITSLHALTTFHCVDNRAYGDKCAERDFSDGEKKIFVCLTVLWVSELPFFTTIEKTKRLLTLLKIGLSAWNLWYSQLQDKHEGIGRGWALSSYLIFVIFFTRAKFLENKIYTKKRQFFALNQ